MSQRWGPKSYAQHGDDFVAINVFELLDIEYPSYLEIGAFDPFEISNTALLYERGSRGLVVDASQESLARFADLRPADKRLYGAVVPSPKKEKETAFYRCSPVHGLNTCDLVEAQTRNTQINDQIMVPAFTLAEVVAQCPYGMFPHFLSIDIEGYDFDVLRTTRFHGDCSPWGPVLICAEVRRHETRAFTAMLKEKGYVPLIRMAENMFFIRQSLFEKVF